MCLEEKNLLKELDIRILILSRSRSNTISTHKFLPDFIEVLVPSSQKEAYESKIKNPIITIPDEIEGLGRVRNWVLRNFDENIIIMIDDDITSCYCLTGKLSRKIEDPYELLQILINTAVMANDLGLHCFGFSQTDIRKYNATEPFKLNSWVGCVIGVIGKDIEFRDDKFKVDIDFCLKCLLVDRIVWIDGRYYFNQNRDNNVGGNSIWRTQEAFEKSTSELCKKWGRFIKTQKSHKMNINLKLNVKRRQRIDYE